MRRLAGAVVFAVIAQQSAALVPTSCDAHHVDPASSEISEMDHGLHGGKNVGATKAPNAPGGPTAPAPNHRPDCDHTVPATECGIGVGCVVAVALASPTIVVSASHTSAAAEVFTASDGPLVRDFAPDTPPPRA